MTNDTLHAERMHLAGLLEAIQRCVYFLSASDGKLSWPLTAIALEQNKKDIDLFESLAGINERFAKLQDTLGAAMRHSVLLSGETGETFLKVLAFYEKTGVIDSIASWQLCRATHNLAAHDYGTDLRRSRRTLQRAAHPDSWPVWRCASLRRVLPQHPGSKPVADRFRKRVFRHHAGQHRAKRDSDMKRSCNLNTLRNNARVCHPSARAIQTGRLGARFDGARLHFFRAAAMPAGPIGVIQRYQ
jgi:hypothetical protein